MCIYVYICVYMYTYIYMYLYSSWSRQIPSSVPFSWISIDYLLYMARISWPNSHQMAVSCQPGVSIFPIKHREPRTLDFPNQMIVVNNWPFLSELSTSLTPQKGAVFLIVVPSAEGHSGLLPKLWTCSLGEAQILANGDQWSFPSKSLSFSIIPWIIFHQSGEKKPNHPSHPLRIETSKFGIQACVTSSSVPSSVKCYRIQNLSRPSKRLVK